MNMHEQAQVGAGLTAWQVTHRNPANDNSSSSFSNIVFISNNEFVIITLS